MNVPADAKWHTVSLHVRDGVVSAKVDGTDKGNGRALVGDGGRITLKVFTGKVEFDDIEFIVPRSSEAGLFYAFDRRETDWLRVGGDWQDHQGIACSLASNWVSLIANEKRGILVNKRAFKGDVTVSFNIGENSQWNGWNVRANHVHYAADNVLAALFSGGDPNNGYRLEVNAERRSATVLYRRGEEVARVVQDASFPIKYTGSHAPYSPRRGRITLVRKGASLRVVINGREALSYTDPKPLETEKVAVGGYDTHINFSHLEIKE